MNFADSLKNWFFNNSSQAASSDARIPLLNADGTPKGSDTMQNIALTTGGRITKTFDLAAGGTISFNQSLTYSVFAIYEITSHGYVGVFATAWDTVFNLTRNESETEDYFTLSFDSNGILVITSTRNTTERYTISLIDSYGTPRPL